MLLTIVGCSREQNKILSSDELIGVWYLKTTDTNYVFVKDKEEIPPRRFYTQLIFEVSGSYSLTQPGPTDRPVTISGKWESKNEKKLVMNTSTKTYNIEIVRLNDLNLVLSDLPK